MWNHGCRIYFAAFGRSRRRTLPTLVLNQTLASRSWRSWTNWANSDELGWWPSRFPGGSLQRLDEILHVLELELRSEAGQVGSCCAFKECWNQWNHFWHHFWWQWRFLGRISRYFRPSISKNPLIHCYTSRYTVLVVKKTQVDQIDAWLGLAEKLWADMQGFFSGFYFGVVFSGASSRLSLGKAKPQPWHWQSRAHAGP